MMLDLRRTPVVQFISSSSLIALLVLASWSICISRLRVKIQFNYINIYKYMHFFVN